MSGKWHTPIRMSAYWQCLHYGVCLNRHFFLSLGECMGFQCNVSFCLLSFDNGDRLVPSVLLH